MDEYLHVKLMETISYGQTDISSPPTNSDCNQEMGSCPSQLNSSLEEMETSRTTTIPSDSEDEISLQKQRKKMIGV